MDATRGYGLPAFREDLLALMTRAGVEGKPTVFLLADSQITDEAFLEDVNNLLNAGEVRGARAQHTQPRMHALAYRAALITPLLRPGLLTLTALFSFLSLLLALGSAPPPPLARVRAPRCPTC